MNCPSCNVELYANAQHGIEIDYCRSCHGGWIAKGGLIRVVEKTRPKPQTIRIPSISSQKKDNFELLYEGDV